MDEIAGLAGGASEGPAGAKRVVRTGLALVHENELVLPAEGSEAGAILALEDAGTEVHLHFPVEVEIRLAPGDGADVAAEIERALHAVARRLSGIA